MEELKNEWLDKLKAADVIAFDTETTSLDSMVAQLVGVSLVSDTMIVEPMTAIQKLT